MRNKLLKISMSLCLLFICVVLVTGCLNYGCTIQFETWGGTNIPFKHYDYNSTIFTSDFGKPNKTGYNFVSWYYDDKFENEITGESMVALNMNVTYYAKYELDEDYFISTSNYYVLDNDELIIDNDNLWTDWIVEIDKINTSHTFSQIKVERDVQSQYVCKDIVVYDSNGKTMKDANSYMDIFELEEGISASTKFVIRVSTFNAGACKLIIS